MADSKVFDVADTKKTIEEELTGVLGNSNFDPKKVQQWCQEIVQRVLKRLVDANKNQDYQYKYVVNAVVLEKTGAGLHSTSSCLWDKSSDDSASVQWDNDSMYCVCSVWALRCN